MSRLPLYVQAFLGFLAVWLAVVAVAALALPSALQPLGLFGALVAVPWALWCLAGLLVQWLAGLLRRPV